MSGPIGPQLALPADSGRALGMQAGQTRQAVVQGDSQSGFSVQWGNKAVPLPPEGSWTAGQTVQLTAVLKGGALRIEVAALNQPGIAGQPAALAPLARLVSAFLPALGGGLSTEQAVALLPGNLPGTSPAIASLLGVFFGEPAAKSVLAPLFQWLQQARASGRLGPDAQKAADAMLQLSEADPSTWEGLLRLLARDATAEAQVAKGELPENLRTLITRLMDDDTVKALLGEQRNGPAIQDAAQTLLSRLDSVALANARGLERAYFFLELPFLWLSGFQRAQVHVFADGRRGGERAGKAPATVSLDLALDALGPVWVTLRRDAASCVCEFIADEGETRALLLAEQDDLVASLEAAGLPQPVVRVRAPTEERAQRLVALLRGGQPMDQTA